MAEPTIYEAHPLVYHYTNHFGLSGILESQTLYATHYRHLNDTTEIEHMRVFLVQKFQHFIKEFHKEALHHPSNRQKVASAGGEHIIAFREAEKIIEILYRITFGGVHFDKQFADPYITSFCSHVDDEDYEKENGLLSQWRSYAGDEGYAIVFNTEELCRFIDRESDYYSLLATFGDVVYEGDDEEFDREFRDLFEGLEKIYENLFSEDEPKIAEVFGPFVNSVSRFKHQAFREEREVRIIISPNTKEFDDYIKSADPTYVPPDKHYKEIFTREKNGITIPTIRLFDYPKDDKLPITKIIVGPHRNQVKNLQIAKELVEQIEMDVEVYASETPYTGA